MIYVTGSGLITVIWHKIISAISTAYWKRYYLHASVLHFNDKRNIEYLLQKKTDEKLKKKLFHQYILYNEPQNAVRLYNSQDINKLDKNVLSELFYAHFDLEEYNRAAEIGFFLLHENKEVPQDPRFIKTLFLCSYHCAEFKQCLDLYYTVLKFAQPEKTDLHYILAVYTVLKESRQFEETCSFLREYSSLMKSDNLQKILRDFLKYSYEYRQFSTITFILDTFFFTLPPHTLYYYLLRLKGKMPDQQKKYYDILIRFYKEYKQTTRLQSILREYFLTGLPFCPEHYHLWKKHYAPDKDELQKIIEIYPYDIEPYKDYLSLLTSPSEKSELLEKVQQAMKTASEPSVNNFQGMATALKKELLQSRKQDLQKSIDDNLDKSDVVKEYLLILAETNDSSETHSFLQKLKKRFQKHPDLKSIVWEVIRNNSGSFHIGESLMNYYYQAEQPEFIYKLVSILSEYTLESDRYLYEKYHELQRRFPDFQPVYPELVQILFPREEYKRIIELCDKYFEKLEIPEYSSEIYPLYLLSLGYTEQKEAFIKKTRLFLENNTTDNIELIRCFVRNLQTEKRYEEALTTLQNYSHNESVVEIIAELEEDYSEYKKNALLEKIDSNAQDYKSCFLLGKLYLTEKDWNQAFVYFQKCFSSEEYGRLSHAYGAYVLAQKNLLELSEELLFQVQLNKQEIPPDELNTLKDIFYDTAQIFDNNKMYSRSVNIYLQIFKIDANFRDVMKKIENFDLYRKQREKKM